ncbi:MULTISPECIES: phosphopantetheine-binding protein [Chryseobacterium]|jgi:acyl carrier protein|uniref:phosphopantetheine-binding protein n=1 Tax=Chryseobacterium TaxID=59732 RepID=UPI000F50FFB1|nr:MULTISPECIES: phosphopantetheine-binding protein [Chryseobacterium]AZB34990.1 acyl carrier protein [Chryseobacterium bernardetii]UCA58827.1 phosphopantetheine-binding protein [Chryseobacterium rhizoplanae]
MKTSVFLEKLQEELEEKQALERDTRLKDLENYDSISLLSVIAFVDENFNQQLDPDQFKDMETVSDLMNIIGLENFEEN